MRRRRMDWLTAALVTLWLLLPSSPARAQGNIGTGPLTQTLTDVEPTSGVLSIGRFKLAPGVVIREIGWDSNVFDEAENPKEDYLASIVPDVSVFTRLRFMQLSAYGGMDFNYFKTYESERSTGHAVRGRVDFLLSRVRPFVGAGQNVQRTRPNGEIDVRADRREEELSAGLAFELGTHSVVYGGAYRYSVGFEDAFQAGINLQTALNRDSDEYSGGVRTDLTPLTALTVFGAFRQDRFASRPDRNAETRSATASLRIGAEAVVTGVVSVNFRDFKPVDPLIEPFRGLGGMVSLIYPLLEVGRLSFIANRGIDYSFDVAEAYFLENSFTLAYSHRLFGSVDAQVKGAKSWFDYGFREGSPARTEKFDSLQGGVGYNLRNRTRVSLNYEYARRRSPELRERNYDRRRAYAAWTFGF